MRTRTAAIAMAFVTSTTIINPVMSMIEPIYSLDSTNKNSRTVSSAINKWLQRYIPMSPAGIDRAMKFRAERKRSMRLLYKAKAAR